MTIRVPACYMPKSQHFRFIPGQSRPEGVSIGMHINDVILTINFGHPWRTRTNSHAVSPYEDYLEFWNNRKWALDSGEITQRKKEYKKKYSKKLRKELQERYYLG